MEIVGGSGVLIVVDGSGEDDSKDLQLCQPVLKGRFAGQSDNLSLSQSLQLADSTPASLPSRPAAGKLLPNTFFDGCFFFPCRDMGFGSSMPSEVEKAN